MRASAFFDGKIFTLGYDTSRGKILGEVTRAIASYFKKQAYIGVVGWSEAIAMRGVVLKSFGKCFVLTVSN